MAFTDKSINALKSKVKPYEKGDGGWFGIRVGKRSKTWVYVYHFDARPRRLTLGSYEKMGTKSMSLADARIAFGKAKKLFSQGIDPATVAQDQKREEAAAETVAELVAEYLERHAEPNKKSAHLDRMMLHREIIPVLGRKKARDVTRRDIVLLLDKMQDRGVPIQRNRTQSTTSRMFRFGVQRGLLDVSPCQDIPRVKEAPRERALAIEEIASFWNSLGDAKTSPAIKLALLLPRNAFWPVAISYSTAPKAKMSVRASTSSPSNCSGAMYCRVPTSVPSSVSGFILPVIEVERVAAYVDHAVDRGRAAHDLAARAGDAAAAEIRLRFRPITPVIKRHGTGIGQRRRHLNKRPDVAAAIFQDQHPMAAGLRQPMGQHRTGGSGADDDVVEGRRAGHQWLEPGRMKGEMHAAN